MIFSLVDEPSYLDTPSDWTEELLKQFKLPRPVISGSFWRNSSNSYFGSKTYTSNNGTLKSSSGLNSCPSL